VENAHHTGKGSIRFLPLRESRGQLMRQCHELGNSTLSRWRGGLVRIICALPRITDSKTSYQDHSGGLKSAISSHQSIAIDSLSCTPSRGVSLNAFASLVSLTGYAKRGDRRLFTNTSEEIHWFTRSLIPFINHHRVLLGLPVCGNPRGDGPVSLMCFKMRDRPMTRNP